MFTIEELKENYKNFDDAKIEKIALNPTGLRREVVPILKEEIKKRGLNIELMKWVGYEAIYFEGLEREKLLTDIRRSICSNCNINTDLKGYRFNTVISAFILLGDVTKEKIICAKCARKMRTRSMLKTFFLGWWSRQGILMTPYALFSDIIRIFRVERESEEIIDKFIDANTGVLRMSMDEKIQISEVLRGFNDLDKDLQSEQEV